MRRQHDDEAPAGVMSLTGANSSQPRHEIHPNDKEDPDVHSLHPDDVENNPGTAEVRASSDRGVADARVGGAMRRGGVQRLDHVVNKLIAVISESC